MAKHRDGNRNAVRDNIGWIFFFVILIAAATFILLSIFAPSDYQKKQEAEKGPEKVAIVTPVNEETTTTAAPTVTTAPTEAPADASHTPAQFGGEGVSETNTLTGSINYVASDNGYYRIRLNIEQLLDTVGTCNLKMTTVNGDEITRSVRTATNPASSTCEGFDINLNGLSSGDWHIRIDVIAGTKSGTFERDVTI